LFHFEFRFIALWPKSCEQVPEFLDLANILVPVFDLRQQAVQAFCPQRNTI
jgi:hypothetical protein